MMRFVSALVVVAALAVFGQDSVPFRDPAAASFSCTGRPYGYYADVSTDCQTFHICLNDYMWSFQCPNLTRFNQEYFVCDHEGNVDCSLAESLYSLNDNFGKVEEQQNYEPATDAPAEP